MDVVGRQAIGEADDAMRLGPFGASVSRRRCEALIAAPIFRFFETLEGFAALARRESRRDQGGGGRLTSVAPTNPRCTEQGRVQIS